MSIEIKAPTFPESVADGTIANWLKKEGENVNQDEVIAEIETDKVVLEVLAQSDGIISKILKSEGETVASSEIIGEFEESDGSSEIKNTKPEKKDKPAKEEKTKTSKTAKTNTDNKKIAPAAKKMIVEENLDFNDINPTGKDNRITKADVVNHLNPDHEVDNFVESSVRLIKNLQTTKLRELQNSARLFAESNLDWSKSVDILDGLLSKQS